jgi:hypothetical protein
MLCPARRGGAHDGSFPVFGLLCVCSIISYKLILIAVSKFSNKATKGRAVNT